MVENTAKDYANYLEQLNFTKEIDPICSNIDSILTRMDEFESTLSMIKSISASSPVQNIVMCRDEFQQYFNKIDASQIVIDKINEDLTLMERNVTKAEEELGYNESGIKGFLKPLIGKVMKNNKINNESNDNNEQLAFHPTKVFKAVELFPKSNVISDDT